MKMSRLSLFCFSFVFIVCFGLNGKEKDPYERFIGLGNCCVTRNQINLHLMKRFGKDQHFFGGGQLFDWLVVHDYNKLAKAFENDLLDLFDRSDLVIVNKESAHPNVKNIKYNMTWAHLFSRDVNNLITNIDLEYDCKKQKIEYLSNKFRELKKYRTLYIIAYPFEGNGPFDTIKPTKKVLIRLRNALKNIRGNNNFSILFCSLENASMKFENIYFRKIVNPINGTPCQGDNACWDELLSQFPFILNQQETDGSGMDDSISG
jgi:hypothetical protein